MFLQVLPQRAEQWNEAVGPEVWMRLVQDLGGGPLGDQALILLANTLALFARVEFPVGIGSGAALTEAEIALWIEVSVRS